MSADLVAFINSALDDEHEVAARENQSWAGSHWQDVAGEADSMLVGIFSPARVLAEVAAKRAILAAYEHKAESMSRYPNQGNANGLVVLGQVLRLLVQPFASRAGFDPSWLD